MLRILQVLADRIGSAVLKFNCERLICLKRSYPGITLVVVMKTVLVEASVYVIWIEGAGMFLQFFVQVKMKDVRTL